MTDTFARMRQITGTTAEWASNDIVLAYGEIGIERVSATEIKAKIGDSTQKWSALPYLSANPVGINTATQTALNAKLPIAGGTMTGSLILDHIATQPNEAVTLAQLQGEVAQLNTAIGGKLGTTGGTMTGTLTLAADATQNKEPVTLDQMSKAISAAVGSTSGGIAFTGTVDPTKAYAAPTPAPTKSGAMYTTTTNGPFNASWTSHVQGSHPATVSVGDQLIWDATVSKFHYIASSTSGVAFIPLAGSSLITGPLAWSTDQAKAVIIDGKNGTILNVLIEGGTY